MDALEVFAPSIYKGAAPGANKNIFSANLKPIRKGYSRLLIQIQLVNASIVNLIVSPSPAPAAGIVQDTLVCPINSGNQIPAGELQVFEAIVSSDHEYNLQLATDGVISLLYLSTVKAG